jgi:hypothetical protein
MDEPSLERYGFIGGIIAGALLAWREIRAWLKRTDEESKQRVITPADVRELVLLLHNKVELLNSNFSALQQEEIRAHERILIELRDALHRLDYRDRSKRDGG